MVNLRRKQALQVREARQQALIETAKRRGERDRMEALRGPAWEHASLRIRLSELWLRDVVVGLDRNMQMLVLEMAQPGDGWARLIERKANVLGVSLDEAVRRVEEIVRRSVRAGHWAPGMTPEGRPIEDSRPASWLLSLSVPIAGAVPIDTSEGLSGWKLECERRHNDAALDNLLRLLRQIDRKVKLVHRLIGPDEAKLKAGLLERLRALEASVRSLEIEDQVRDMMLRVEIDVQREWDERTGGQDLAAKWSTAETLRLPEAHTLRRLIEERERSRREALAEFGKGPRPKSREEIRAQLRRETTQRKARRETLKTAAAASIRYRPEELAINTDFETVYGTQIEDLLPELDAIKRWRDDDSD